MTLGGVKHDWKKSSLMEKNKTKQGAFKDPPKVLTVK